MDLGQDSIGSDRTYSKARGCGLASADLSYGKNSMASWDVWHSGCPLQMTPSDWYAYFEATWEAVSKQFPQLDIFSRTYRVLCILVL